MASRLLCSAVCFSCRFSAFSLHYLLQSINETSVLRLDWYDASTLRWASATISCVCSTWLQNSLFLSFIVDDSSHLAGQNIRGFKSKYVSILLPRWNYSFKCLVSWTFGCTFFVEIVKLHWWILGGRQARIYNQCRLSGIDCNWFISNLSLWNLFNDDIWIWYWLPDGSEVINWADLI